MNRAILRDDQWERIKDLLPGKPSDCGVTASDNRLFLEAVLWIARTGSPWRDLPTRFGHWHRVYVRYNRWAHKGHRVRIFEAIANDPDLEYLMVDGSIIRVHQHGAVDALGNPVRFILTAGRHFETNQANQLIEGFSSDYVIADKGYDADRFIAAIETGDAIAVIPPKKDRKTAREYDVHLYQERNLVERIFTKAEALPPNCHTL